MLRKVDCCSNKWGSIAVKHNRRPSREKKVKGGYTMPAKKKAAKKAKKTK
jgi:hypothetical protein